LAQSKRPSTAEIAISLLKNWKLILSGTLLVSLTTVAFYLLTTYTPTYGELILHLTMQNSLVVTLCVGVSNLIMLPAMGALSDRIGRRPLLLSCALIVLLTAYPAMSWLVAQPSFARLLIVEVWLSLLYAGYNGAMIVHLTEIIPVEVRTTGFSIAYSLATALFGGFTPVISTYLIHVTSNKAMPSVWLSFAAVCAISAMGWTAGRSNNIGPEVSE